MNLKYRLLSLLGYHAFIVIFTFQYIILTHSRKKIIYSFFLRSSVVLSYCTFDKTY